MENSAARDTCGFWLIIHGICIIIDGMLFSSNLTITTRHTYSVGGLLKHPVDGGLVPGLYLVAD